MNTAGIKEYICPNCKKSFTRLERSTPRLVLGAVITFLSIPGILFGILIVSAPNGSKIAGWIFFIAPLLFALLGLRLLSDKRCPNCGSKANYIHIKLPIITEIVNKLTKVERLGTRLGVSIFFIGGLYFVGLGLRIILLSGELQGQDFIFVGIFMAMSMFFALVGVWAIFRPESFRGWDSSGYG